MRTVMLAAVCALVVPVTAAAQPADASGRWEATFATDQGTIPATMVLKKEGEKLSGTITGPQGEVGVAGTQKGAAIFLSLTLDTQNGPMTIALSATQEGDTMSGSADMAGQAQIAWSAKRAGGTTQGSASASVPAADVGGAWALEVNTGAGSGSPTVTFKQSGDTLTGQYKGQFGELPVTGTVRGSAVTFQFTVDVQGTSMTVVYSGTVEKDSMKGTVQLGDVGEGTFTGSRKK